MPRPRRRATRPAKPSAAPLLILTGLSGSGKGTVLRALEDLGIYCVDNLPIPLIPTFADLYVRSGDEVGRAALLVDIREGEALRDFPTMFTRLRRRVPTSLVFIEANDATLQRRFSETRRPHPLGADLPVPEGVRRERRLLRPIRALADVVLDTSRFTPHDLRQLVHDRFARAARSRRLLVSLVSFGYRHGLPPDADLVFDARFLPNPNFVPAYKPLTGRDARVARYVLSSRPAREFVRRIAQLLKYLLPHYQREGKSYLTVAFGCTGGRHRSVAIAQAMARRLAGAGRRIRVSHRDLPRSR